MVIVVVVIVVVVLVILHSSTSPSAIVNCFISFESTTNPLIESRRILVSSKVVHQFVVK